MYQYEKSRKAQLHEKSFSWFEGIGAFPQQAKKAFCTYKCTACQLAILKADNDNWLPKQFKRRKGRTNEKEIL